MKCDFAETDKRRAEICAVWGLFRESEPMAQMVKLAEEQAELKQALLDDNRAEVIDAIGDSLVVLGNIANMVGLDLAECYAAAVEVISKRKGTIIDGIFCKEGE